MIEFIGGLLVGLVAGCIIALEQVRWNLITGRLTQRAIAEYCDVIIDAQQEATEEASPKRTPL